MWSSRRSPLGFVWDSHPTLGKIPIHSAGNGLPGFSPTKQEMHDWNYQLKKQMASDKALRWMQQTQSSDLSGVRVWGKEKSFKKQSRENGFTAELFNWCESCASATDQHKLYIPYKWSQCLTQRQAWGRWVGIEGRHLNFWPSSCRSNVCHLRDDWQEELRGRNPSYMVWPRKILSPSAQSIVANFVL